MMDHLDPDELAVLAMDGGTVDDAEAAHLDGCARCAGEIEVLRSVSDRARRSRPADAPPAPPEDVWDRVVHELTASGDLATPEPARPAPIWRTGWALAAAFVLVVVLGAAALIDFGGTGGGGEVVAEATLEPLAAVEAGTASLRSEGQSRTLTIDTAELPETDGYYELWLLAADGTEMVSLGPVDGGERYEIPEAVDVDVFSVVDISREPTDGDPTHSTDSVLRGPLQPTA